MEVVKARLWHGSVNVRVVFRDAQYLFRANRNSYFALHFAQLLQFFAAATNTPIDGPVWLEYDDTPLKWNLPVGVLHDLLFLPSRTGADKCWTLYFKALAAYPADDIIPFAMAYEAQLNQVLINQLKQSCYVMSGNSRAVMSLSEDDTRTLWHAVTTLDYTVASTINKKLVARTPQRVPVKIYLSGSDRLVQAPIVPTEDGPLLHAVLAEHMPECFAAPGFAAYIHGINADVLFPVSILDVWSTFHHLDNFLYVVVIATPAPGTPPGARSGTS